MLNAFQHPRFATILGRGMIATLASTILASSAGPHRAGSPPAARWMLKHVQHDERLLDIYNHIGYKPIRSITRLIAGRRGEVRVETPGGRREVIRFSRSFATDTMASLRSLSGC